MKVYTDIERLPAFNKAVVTIGTFDGVHLGHQKIIRQLKTEADKIEGETVIITFHPHPRKVVLNAKNIRLITTIDERIELLEQKGIDNLVIVPFTRGFSELEPENYVEEFLKAKFNPAVVIIGYDHKFGKERKGDYKLLEEYSSKGYFALKEIPQQLINDSTVSSTLIRNALTEGKISFANNLLGYTFYFDGKVVKGDQRGRTIGYPTANLKVEVDDKIIPANGVYAVEAMVSVNHQTAILKGEGTILKGMMNIGVRPTVDGKNRSIEVNLFDFDEDIYGGTLRVYVKSFLRPEQKFNNLDELKKQLANDKIEALLRL
jgi:riboflavin kinase/FMN adenylyltransferase